MLPAGSFPRMQSGTPPPQTLALFCHQGLKGSDASLGLSYPFCQREKIDCSSQKQEKVKLTKSLPTALCSSNKGTTT